MLGARFLLAQAPVRQRDPEIHLHDTIGRADRPVIGIAHCRCNRVHASAAGVHTQLHPQVFRRTRCDDPRLSWRHEHARRRHDGEKAHEQQHRRTQGDFACDSQPEAPRQQGRSGQHTSTTFAHQQPEPRPRHQQIEGAQREEREDQSEFHREGHAVDGREERLDTAYVQPELVGAGDDQHGDARHREPGEARHRSGERAQP